MVKLEEYKLVLAVVGLIGVLLLASPVIAAVVRFPGGEQFSELYVLGPGHMAENYPYSVVPGRTYSVYVGVGNHLGSSAFYVLYVMFQNRSDTLPNATTGAPSPSQPLYEYRFAVTDGNVWENFLSFSVSNTSISANQSMIRQLTVNDVGFDVDKPSVWDSNSTSYYYRLVLELWLYDSASNSVQFNSRFVYLQLNLTQSG